MRFADLLRLLVGEGIDVRMPGQKNVPHNNTSPLFYSALEKITPPVGMCRSRPMLYQNKMRAME